VLPETTLQFAVGFQVEDGKNVTGAIAGEDESPRRVAHQGNLVLTRDELFNSEKACGKRAEWQHSAVGHTAADEGKTLKGRAPLGISRMEWPIVMCE